MANEDLIDLLLYLSKQQMNPSTRTDQLATVDILLAVPETVTVTDAVSASTGAHPQKWGSPRWSFATWG